MAKRGLSIEIGVQRTKICEVDFRKKNPKVYRTHVFHTPVNTVEDGYIRDKKAFEVILRKELKQAGMKEKNVIYTIASTTIANREITIPLVKEKQIPAIIKASVQDYFPIDISGYTVAYTILEKKNTKEEKNIRLLLLAAPDSLIKNYYSFSENMGFHIEAIDYVGNSTMQLLKRQAGSRTSLTVQMNEQTTLISIIDHGNLVVQRTVGYGMMSSVEAVMENPVFHKSTEREAHDYLIEDSVILSSLGSSEAEAAATLDTWDEAEGASGEEDLLQARAEVTESLCYHINNVQRLIDYYQSKNPQQGIEKVYLSGTGARIKGIEELFQSELGIKTKCLSKLVGVSFGKKGRRAEEEPTEFISVVGAAINPLNFTLKEAVEGKSQKDEIKSSGKILAFSVVASGIIIVSSVVQYKNEELTNQKLNRKIEQLKAIEEVYTENEAVTAYYNDVTTLYEMTRTRNEEFGELIGELERELPSNMYVTSMSGNETSVSINLETTTKISVAKLLLNLQRIELLEEISVPSVSGTSAEGEENRYVFSVTAKYAGNGEKTTLPEVAEAAGETGGEDEN